ncbi:MAG TPA: TonB-dependent receptor [Micropepsaceae bacterium]|nr:TonB-dependent receptor [Micropepsaceae bacterium]
MPQAPRTGCAPHCIAVRALKSDSTIAAVFIAASLAGVAPANAGESAAVPETVLITARPPDPVGNAAFSTTLIDAPQLRVAPELDQALRQVPGLSLFRRNSSLSANPSVQGVSLRSIAPSGAGRAIVTLDGVPQNDPFGGWVIWSSLPAENIQSAEIVRGAGAGPYGAGALTGVIALSEREGAGFIGDAFGGETGQARIAGAGGVQVGKVSFGASGMYHTSEGWVPVQAPQRGNADTPVTLKARSLSGHVATEVLEGTLLAARFGWYDEKRNSGIGTTYSHAKGTTGSITIAHPEESGDLGWRAQAWYRDTDLANTSAAVGAGRATTTPSNNQYATPAIGWGGNAALRGTFAFADWEVGADGRFADGESRELFTFQTGSFRSSRFAGGRSFVGGIYGETATRLEDGWLLTAGIRVDEWENTNGHIIERSLATNAVTLDSHPASRSGAIPTARAGVRKELGDGLYLRSSAYEGFRAPSLNELYRPFRLGNNFTQSNAALEPERLYGVELGAGDDEGALTWNLTGFWNRLSGAISNVTVGTGPGTFPGVGFLPAGGLYIQRQNVGSIRAYGLEGDAQWELDPDFALRGAFTLTDAKVNGGTSAAQLTGKRPSQTPRWTVTGGVVASPFNDLTLEAYLRYESLRFSDDLNTLRLPDATTIDAKATWHIWPTTDLYLAVDNLFNAKVATSRGGDQVVTYDAPRMLRIGVTVALAP